MTDFGTRLKILRKSRGWSQKTLGDKLGMHKNVISYYELGQRLPDVEALVSIANLFHVSVDYLLGHDTPALLLNGLSESQSLILSALANEFLNTTPKHTHRLTPEQQRIMNEILGEFTAERE